MRPTLQAESTEQKLAGRTLSLVSRRWSTDACGLVGATPRVSKRHPGCLAQSPIAGSIGNRGVDTERQYQRIHRCSTRTGRLSLVQRVCCLPGTPLQPSLNSINRRANAHITFFINALLSLSAEHRRW